MFRKVLFVFSAIFLALAANQTMADGGNVECPVGLFDKDSDGNLLSPDAMFGPGTSEIMNCIKSRTNVKMVIQDNAFCRDAVPDADCDGPTRDVNGNVTGAGRAYALAQAYSIIRDYEVTHGMKPGVDYEIVIVSHGGGGKHLVDKTFNKYKDNVIDLMNKGVKFYFCMNTVRSFKKKGMFTGSTPTETLIPGVEYVTGGLTAITDLQKQGYVYIQP